jgi:DNA-binding transcriptional ArsR family regulator
MNTENSPVSKLLPHQKPAINAIAKALGSSTRWAILAELSDGQPAMVLGLAKKLKLPPSTVSQHIGVLRRAGLVVAGLGRLYTIAPPYLADAAQGHLDFGHCLLRLKETAEPPAA